MLTDKENTRISKFLSLVLRHQPDELGITLDESGWTNVDALIAKMKGKGFHITKEILDHVVETNNKKRFAYNEDQSKIRASQGHSIEVDLAYTPQQPPDILYHGTAERFVDLILHEGLKKRSRHHVHLSSDKNTALNVGQRHGKPVIFEVASGRMHKDGIDFFVSENGVWLTDHVPANYLRLI